MISSADSSQHPSHLFRSPCVTMSSIERIPWGTLSGSMLDVGGGDLASYCGDESRCWTKVVGGAPVGMNLPSFLRGRGNAASVALAEPVAVAADMTRSAWIKC